MSNRLFCLMLLTLAHVSLFIGQTYAQNKNSPVVFLRLEACEQPPTFSQTKSNGGDAVVHELCRQAILLSARDLGKVIVRDEGMGDQEPDKNRKDTLILTLKSGYVPGKHVKLSLDQDTAGKSKHLWDSELLLDGEKDTIEQLIEFLEDKSRTEIGAILKNEIAVEPRAAGKSDLKAVNALVDDFHFLSQFEAARRLHSSHDNKDSSSLLVLAKAYSQLALLTRYHWTHQHRVCQARSLLYAQRLLKLYPKESGQSILASCLSLAGYHKQALTRFDLAEKAGEKLSTWATLAKLASQFDHQALEKRAAEDIPESELAYYLAFRVCAREPTMGLQGLNAQATRIGLAIVERKPESYPVIHRLSLSNTLGVKQHMTIFGPDVLARQLPTRLAKMNDLPATVKDTQSSSQILRDCPLALVKEGVLDPIDPSWSSVGLAISQSFFQQAQQRAEFMHSFWVVPTREYLAEVMPLLEGHPQLDIVKIAAGDKGGDSHPFIPPKRGDNRYLEMARYCRSLLGDNAGNAMFTCFLYQRPQNGDDLAMMETAWNDGKFLQMLGKVLLLESPYHPLAPALLLRSGSANVLESLPSDHETRYGSHSIYLYEYGQWLMRNQKYDQAEKILTQLVKVNPNAGGYEALAGYYLKVNNRKKWEETLEKYLKLPDLGLQPASTRLDLAEYHASQKNWEKAKSYAGEAAETYAAWALFRASRVFALAGDFETSENYIQAMSTRYQDSIDQWFRWCIRYNRGNRNAAFALIKTSLDRKGTLSRIDNMVMGYCHEAMNQPKEAVAYYTKVYAAGMNLDVAMRCAMLEAEQDHKDARDQWMVKVFAPEKSRAGQQDYQVQIKIAEMLLESYKTGKLQDYDGIERIVIDSSDQIRQCLYYLLGRYCEQHKEIEKAQSLYRRGLTPKLRDSWIYLLCEARLRAITNTK